MNNATFIFIKYLIINCSVATHVATKEVRPHGSEDATTTTTESFRENY
jgi:hypothetical protein